MVNTPILSVKPVFTIYLDSEFSHLPSYTKWLRCSFASTRQGCHIWQRNGSTCFRFGHKFSAIQQNPSANSHKAQVLQGKSRGKQQARTGHLYEPDVYVYLVWTPSSSSISFPAMNQATKGLLQCAFTEHKYIKGMNKAYIPVRKPINGTGFSTCSAFWRWRLSGHNAGMSIKGSISIKQWSS